jgi:hypothetical protein
MGKKIEQLRNLINNDSIAITYQSMGQYRSMLLKEINKTDKDRCPICGEVWGPACCE